MKNVRLHFKDKSVDVPITECARQDVGEKADEVVPQNLSIVSSTVSAIFIAVIF